MGGDKRISRTERSGRYGSDQSRGDSEWRERRGRDQDREPDRDHDMRRWGEDRRGDRYDGDRRGNRDQSPERERKRRNSDRSEDGYHSDGDYPEQDFRREAGDDRKSKTIMLWGLPHNITEDEIRGAIEPLEGPQPVDIRLVKKKTGISRGFAFVDFYHLQDATRWMETNQKRLTIQGKYVDMQYSNPRNKFEDWLCNTCGLYNFRRRLKCFRCGATKAGCSAPAGLARHVIAINAIILRNIAPLTTVEAILTLLAPYANLLPNNIRLIKDKLTGQNRGFAFVQLSSPLEASQLLTILQGLQPPLKLDGKTIGVDYAKSARKDLLLSDGNRISAFSMASTAIAAAQWSSTQAQQGPDAMSEYSYLQEGYAPLSQVSPDTVSAHHRQPREALCLGSTATRSERCSPLVMHDLVTTRAIRSYAHVKYVLLPTAAPDISTYQYDESSGYYYDPQTGLFYDPNSQYHYNAQTQQYLYWDSEKQTYVPAAADASTGDGMAAPSSAAGTSKEAKDKKEKPKSKTAQQIAKDMERWAKSLNRQKENFKGSFQPVSHEERREAAAADAGFSLFEKKMGGFEDCGLVAAYSGDSDPEEVASAEQDYGGEDGLTDWKKMACLLCRRQFPNKDGLVRHQQLSDLHKQNLEVLRRSKLTEAELEELERKETEAQLRTKGAGLGTKGSNYNLTASDTYKDAVRKAMFARFTEIE
uniref:RNA binding motif protein 5 n=1 Tax=Gadus morhua TaxID=8049 RepID=A0A8C5C0S5_GADMO